jgi:hypothetical protein
MNAYTHTDDYENIPGRHRFGEPVPLTHQPWNWRVALTWAGCLLLILASFGALVWWARLMSSAMAGVG